MKKGIIVLLLIAIIAFSLSANDRSEAALKINAYKTGSGSTEEYLILKIYDSVTGSLTTLENNDKIDIDDYLSTTDASNKLLGEVSNSPAGRLVFVTHVEGNITGSFTVKVEMTPLAYSDNGKFDLDKRIPFYFHPMNVLYYFKKAEATTTGTYTIADNSSSTAGTTVNTKDNGSINFNWNVTNTEIDALVSDDAWVYRGGVGMVISKDDYAKSPNGKYASTVTITLGVNS